MWKTEVQLFCQTVVILNRKWSPRSWPIILSRIDVYNSSENWQILQERRKHHTHGITPHTVRLGVWVGLGMQCVNTQKRWCIQLASTAWAKRICIWSCCESKLCVKRCKKTWQQGQDEKEGTGQGTPFQGTLFVPVLFESNKECGAVENCNNGSLTFTDSSKLPSNQFVHHD